MAATTAGAVKAYLEAQGLGIAVYRDVAASAAVLPYVTVQELSLLKDALGDFGADLAGTELVQVDLWQTQDAESYTLAEAIVVALQGAVLTQHPKHVYGCVWRDTQRLIDPDGNVIHHAITIALRRAI